MAKAYEVFPAVATLSRPLLSFVVVVAVLRSTRNHVQRVHASYTCVLKTRIPALLYPLCVGAGVCYGSMFALVLALAADLFGPDHLGTNYGLLDLGEVEIG